MNHRTLSHFQILDELGEGGMGIVYKAWDSRLRRHVAIKTLSPSGKLTPERRQRLIQEARAASASNHPAIVTIYDILHDDGKDYVVMELVEGDTLGKLIPPRGFSLDKVLDYGAQIAEALAAAHSQGIIHRDIKPDNIMVTGEGKIKILDFGLAKLESLPASKVVTDASTQTHFVTTEGVVLGTYPYMSPEQALGEKVRSTSDLFSFGVLLYRMLTGRLPFLGPNPLATIHQIIYEEPAAIEALRSGLPVELTALIEASLEKDPDRRVKSAAEMKGIFDGLSGAAQSGASFATARGALTPRRTGFWAAALISTAVIAGVVVSRPDRPSGPTAPTPAAQEKHIAILPLVNIGGNPENQAFSDGLVESLTSKLTQIETAQSRILVVPASEVRSRRIDSVDAARKAFAVSLALTGSLRRDGYQVRLTLNLVDAITLRQVSSAILDLDASNFTELEDRASIRLARMLDVEIEPRLVERLTAGGTSRATSYDLYLQARGHLLRFDQQQQRERSISLFQRSLDIDPNYALASAGLAEAYWREYEATRESIWVDRARVASSRALELDPGLAQVYVTLGLIENGTGRHEEAIEAFERALAIDPRSADAYRGLALAFEAQRMPEQAVAAFKRAADIRPNDWLNYNRLGAFYFRNGQYDEAVEQFRRVTELAPDNTKGHNNLGAVFYYLDRLDEAREMFERSLRVSPNYAAASNLGTINFSQGNYRDAAAAYEIALDISPSDFQVFANLGSAYSLAGDKQKGTAARKRAARMVEERLAVNPNDAALLISLANLHSMTGRHEEVPTLIDRALSLTPDDVEVMITAAEAYEHIGERDSALKWVHEALAGGFPLSGIETNPSFQQLTVDARFDVSER